MKTLIAISIVLYSALAGANTVPSMAVLPVTLATEQTLPLDDAIQLTLFSNGADELAQNLANWAGIEILQIADNQLKMTLSEQVFYKGNADISLLKDSFVIDINEPSTKQFVAGFMQWVSQPWQLTNIAGYVSQYIDKPSYIHGFNFASVVATEKSGDCTEYAALTTALARSLGLPARLVIGAVIMEEATDVSAFGHAWTEVFFNGEWQIIDAAMTDATSVRLFYLPVSALHNEGPGFGMGLMNIVSIMPEKIIDVKNAG